MTYESEREDLNLKQVLRHASQPMPPDGAEGRLMARIRASAPAAAQPAAQVVQFKPRQKSSWRGFMLAGLPLAASLMLGILIGNQNAALDSLLPDGVVALLGGSGSGMELDVPISLDDSDLTDGGLA